MLPFESITVTGIESIVTVSSKQDEIFIMKKRPSYGLSFCLEGQITYLQDGVRYVSDPSCAILLPEGQRYSLHRDKRGRFPLVNSHLLCPPCLQWEYERGRSGECHCRLGGDEGHPSSV